MTAFDAATFDAKTFDAFVLTRSQILIGRRRRRMRTDYCPDDYGMRRDCC